MDPVYRKVPTGLQPDVDGRINRSVTDPYAGNVSAAQSNGGGFRFDLPTLGNPSYGPPRRSVTTPFTGNR